MGRCESCSKGDKGEGPRVSPTFGVERQGVGNVSRNFLFLFRLAPRTDVSKKRPLEVQGIIPQSYLATASLVVEPNGKTGLNVQLSPKMPPVFPGVPSWAQ